MVLFFIGLVIGTIGGLGIAGLMVAAKESSREIQESEMKDILRSEGLIDDTDRD